MTESGNGCGDFYTVRKGEMLSDIAKKNGIALSELLRMNPYLNPTYYLAGQVILVPRDRKKNPE